MKLLIAGPGTPTGKKLVALLKQQSIDHQVMPDRLFTAGDKVAIGQFLNKYKASQFINLHSYHANSQKAVLKAENAQKACQAIQQKHVEMMANLCGQHEIPLIHVSTCFVFDGEKKLGYNEQDDARPTSTYGKTSLKGEQAVIKLPEHIILRSGWMFGQNQCDVIKAWIKTCKKNDGVLKVTRQRFSPTANEDLARVILAMCHQLDCEANVWGTYHYCGLETKKEIEFVQQVLKYASQHDEQVYQLLDSIKVYEQSTVPSIVPNLTLSCKKIFDTFGIKQRSWHGSLQNTIKSIYQGKSGAQSKISAEPHVQVPDSLSSKSLH